MNIGGIEAGIDAGREKKFRSQIKGLPKMDTHGYSSKGKKRKREKRTRETTKRKKQREEEQRGSCALLKLESATHSVVFHPNHSETQRQDRTVLTVAYCIVLA